MEWIFLFIIGLVVYNFAEENFIKNKTIQQHEIKPPKKRKQQHYNISTVKRREKRYPNHNQQLLHSQ